MRRRRLTRNAAQIYASEQITSATSATRFAQAAKPMTRDASLQVFAEISLSLSLPSLPPLSLSYGGTSFPPDSPGLSILAHRLCSIFVRFPNGESSARSRATTSRDRESFVIGATIAPPAPSPLPPRPPPATITMRYSRYRSTINDGPRVTRYRVLA